MPYNDERATKAGKLQQYIARSGKTQRQIAEEIGVEESYVSKMAGGTVGWVNSRKYFAPLVRALGLTPEEVKEIKPDAFVEIATITPASSALTAAALGYTFPEEEEEVIDLALLAAADKYGSSPEFSDLKHPAWLSFLNRIDFRQRPTTPEEWLTKFLKYRDDVDPTRGGERN